MSEISKNHETSALASESQEKSLMTEMKGIFSKIVGKIRKVLGLNTQPHQIGAHAEHFPAANDNANYVEFNESELRNKLKIMSGDITAEECDAMVDAANTELKPYGGVSKAIMDKAGEMVQKECEKAMKGKGRIDLGSAITVSSGNLKTTKHIIRAAVINLGEKAMFEDVAAATANALHEAHKSGAKTVVFPAFGTGAGKLSPEDSAEAMLKGLQAAEKLLKDFVEIKFVINDQKIKSAFEDAIFKSKMEFKIAHNKR